MDFLSKSLIKSFLPESIDGKEITAVFGGGFKPPTAGHLLVIQKALKDNPEIDNVIIYIGSKVRDGITQDQSFKIWDEHYKTLIDKPVRIEKSVSPIGDIYRYAKDNPEDSIYWVIGAREGKEDDIQDITSRSVSIDKYPNLNLKIITTPDGGMSGTNARQALMNDDKESFLSFIPSNSNQDEIWNILSSQPLNEIDFKKYLDKAKKGFSKFIEALKQEKQETQDAFNLLSQSVKGEKELSKEEKKEIGNQLKDVFKTIGYVGLFALPGGSIFTILFNLLKLNKYVLPSAFLDKEGLNESDPKKGTGKKPKGSSRRLYTDENPKDTVKIKFSTRQDIIDTLSKTSFKSKPHARQSQIINLIHQRVRAALGRTKDPQKKAKLRSAFEYIKKRKEASKKKTQRLKKQKLKENQMSMDDFNLVGAVLRDKNKAEEIHNLLLQMFPKQKELLDYNYKNDSYAEFKRVIFHIDKYKIEGPKLMQHTELKLDPEVYKERDRKYEEYAKGKIKKYFRDSDSDPRKLDLSKVPPITIDSAGEVADGNHRAFLAIKQQKPLRAYQIIDAKNTHPNVEKILNIVGRKKQKTNEAIDNSFNKVKFYHDYYTNLSPSTFEITLEENDIRISNITSPDPSLPTPEDIRQIPVNQNLEENDPEDGSATPYGSGYNKLDEEIVGNSIVCDNCGWSWKIADGGDDLFICHKCGHDNTPLNESILKENLTLSPFDYDQDGNESRIGRNINNKKGWRRLGSKSNQNSAIKKYLDKYTSGYKWNNPPKSENFSDENEKMYKTPYIMYIHLLQTSEGENNIVDALNGMVANEPNPTMKQVLQALILVFTNKNDQFKKIYTQFESIIEKNAKDDSGANPFAALKYAYENFNDKKGIFSKFVRNGWSAGSYNLNEANKPYKHKHGFDDKLGKDPFGLNQFAREIMQEEESFDTFDYPKHIKSLTKFMLDKGMKLRPLPTVKFINDDRENAKDFFGKTAYYDPNNHKVVLYTLNRHPKDVMRSFAHEMIHHMQNYEGKLQSIHTQNTNEEGDLPEIEREAYEKGNMTFRSWTDTLTEGILKEGRYDTISNQISRDIFNFWKENIDQGLVTFENSYEHEGEDIDIEATIKLSPEIEYLNVDGGADDETDFIVVNFKVNPDKLPGAWEEISFNLKDVIRHEIEHLTHGEGFMLKPGKYIENDQLIRQMIDMELLPKSSYFKLEKEIDANLQGMYFRAKKEKRPFIDVINTYLDAQDITPKEKQIVLNLWRSRRKALSLPKF